MEKNTSERIRQAALLLWLLVITVALYFYFFKPDFLKQHTALLFGSSAFFGYTIYLVLGALRGFTLIPVTYFIVLGLLVLPPIPLYLLTVLGIIISSATVYYFSNFLNLDTFFERQYPKQIATLKEKLKKNELPIVIGWSFFPFAPTDIICYVCGALQIDLKKLLLGVLIGEGIACALYIFLGKQLLTLIYL